MASEAPLHQAVQAAIVAAAYATTHERLASAAQACQRLGSLTTGRWRSVTQDLDRIEGELERALADATRDVIRQADIAGVDEEALWTVGEASAALDTLREDALDFVEDEEGPTAKLLGGKLLVGATFLDDPDLPNRGTTLLFGWADPLSPASWPWEATWVSGAADADDEDEDVEAAEDELELYETGELEISEGLLDAVAQELGLDQDAAAAAVGEAAAALTRATLLAAMEALDEDEDSDDDEDGPTANGHL